MTPGSPATLADSAFHICEVSCCSGTPSDPFSLFQKLWNAAWMAGFVT